MNYLKYEKWKINYWNASSRQSLKNPLNQFNIATSSGLILNPLLSLQITPDRIGEH